VDHGPLSGSVLVVDDERNIRRTLRMVLEGEGVEVTEVASGEEALERLTGGEAQPDVLLMDVLLPGVSGLEVLDRLAQEGRPPLPVILISGHATVSDAVRATRLGAFDFFEKPLSRDRVVVCVRNALRQSHADRELRNLRGKVHGEIIAGSPSMIELLAMVAKVGRTRARVLITGESGTGKELLARAIHDASDRSEAPFVKVNCAAIPRELIESELFGHEKGAFTGASRQKKGLFEVAHGGTLFLDEIGDMDLDAQAKVLRVLQSGEFTHVGGHDPIEVDVRIVAATHRDLQGMSQTGEFREDLYFRLNVVPLEAPPLRQRSEDIPLLAQHFVASSCEENGLAPKRMDEAALHGLCGHDWPGNVRELKNVIERMVVLSDGDLGESDLPPELRPGNGAGGTSTESSAAELLDEARIQAMLQGAEGDVSLRSFREAMERAFILQRLRELGWNVSRTAEALGVERTHLHRKMKVLGIQRGEG
jgi:DNA-binding NtrC family response regulator